QTALAAARTVREETGVPIEVVDSRTASAAQGLAVWAAARAIDADLPLDTCSAVAQKAAAGVSIFVFVPTVEYFVRGGRLSPIQGRIAELLRLKPILTVRDGKVAPAGKTIGRRRAVRKALSFVTELAQEMGAPIFIVAHAAAPKLAQHYAGALHRGFPASTVMVTDAAPALGSHAGPGGAAIAVLDTEPIEQMIEAAKNGGEG
ncbi:DegV family EDD domain-containing protein, partial [Candidatus Bipolaricaulota bacterium]|nr:DegV family EDD domain-containing protein [Candidatus Bipolaricaulota bacterium]